MRLKQLTIELSDGSVLSLGEQTEPLTIKDLCDLVVTLVYNAKIAKLMGVERAQWETAQEVGLTSTSSVYRRRKKQQAETGSALV